MLPPTPLRERRRSAPPSRDPDVVDPRHEPAVGQNLGSAGGGDGRPWGWAEPDRLLRRPGCPARRARPGSGSFSTPGSSPSTEPVASSSGTPSPSASTGAESGSSAAASSGTPSPSASTGAASASSSGTPSPSASTGAASAILGGFGASGFGAPCTDERNGPPRWRSAIGSATTGTPLAERTLTPTSNGRRRPKRSASGAQVDDLESPGQQLTGYHPEPVA